MSDTFTCPECHKSWDYYAVTKRLDPRPGVRRVICGDCHSKISAELKAKSLADTAPYQKGSESSRDGARRAAPKVQGQALKVLEVLSQAPHGLIEEEIRGRLNMQRNECTRAISGLHKRKVGDETPKLAEVTGRRPAPSSGVSVQVYAITEAGRVVLGQTERRAA